MTEVDLIRNTLEPRTRETLARDLRGSGLGEGRVVIVHASLSALGWVCGGAVAVVHALLDVLGPTGSLVMPAHTPDLTNPANWEAPPVPSPWVKVIQAHMPAFDPLTTPTRAMGAVAELFRTWPTAKRSDHPTFSFSACGPLADWMVGEHEMADPAGERSPLAKLYQIDADILLLGVGFDKCTMLHLAEQRAWPDRPADREGSPVMVEGERRWLEYDTTPLIDSRHFLPIGEGLLKAELAKRAKIGSANCILVSSRVAVDCAVEIWRDMQPPSQDA